MNRPATPTATAARASTGTISRWPPLLVPWPPGNCTLWVTSKTTGAPVEDGDLAFDEEPLEAPPRVGDEDADEGNAPAPRTVIPIAAG